ncbi:AbiJ-related protein [Acidithiobacillus ferriphilus]|uniref:AbiJ-related protein n=1 Tax=Acidithiobacillus ferriphilus TaxID=1689834 RepID=UPI0040574569
MSEATRRDITDSLMLENVNWAGRLEEPDFLARLFDVKSLPSKDHRPPVSDTVLDGIMQLPIWG